MGIKHTIPSDLVTFVTYRKGEAISAHEARQAEFLALGDPDRRMTAGEDAAYWAGFYAGQADAYRIVKGELIHDV